MSRAYLCVSIDTECDKGPQRRPPTFDGIHVGILERLHPLFVGFGAKPTYLVAPDVLGDARSSAALRAIESECELGALLGGDVERTTLRELTDRFIRAFEHQPASFRTGRVGPQTIPWLEELGYATDSSVTPDVDGAAHAPTQPYTPDPDEPTRRGSSTIVEIPVTFRRRFWRLAPWSLRPATTPGERLVRLAEDEIAEARRASPGRRVVLNAMLHNADIVATDGRKVLDRLRTLLAFAQRESIAVIGLGDVPEILSA